MSRHLHKLYALQVSRLDRIGRHSDGGGLYLSIGKDGRRRWVFIYRDRRTKKLREMGLGSTDIVSLAKARERATNARALLSDGLDPIAERKGKAGGGGVGDVVNEVAQPREDPEALPVLRCGVPAGRVPGPRLALRHVWLFLGRICFPQ